MATEVTKLYGGTHTYSLSFSIILLENEYCRCRTWTLLALVATMEPLPNWTMALTLTSLLHSTALTTILLPRPWRMEGNGGTAIPDWTAAIYRSLRGNSEEGTSKSSRKPFLFNNVSHDCVVATGIESRWGRNFAPVHNGPGTQIFSCAIGTSSFLGVKCGHGMLLTTDPF